ncbi:hypothetical protein L2E82_02894 [Cichorium intybus]|uniref:Uncharacterized protein n=1 Tax=Cichorium intybus TaxID=13427 RepID=A0ACB9H444_CICIN|nr:hypothetical protein L2E82_02894 [Cichorium intybus]
MIGNMHPSTYVNIHMQRRGTPCHYFKHHVPSRFCFFLLASLPFSDPFFFRLAVLYCPNSVIRLPLQAFFVPLVFFLFPSCVSCEILTKSTPKLPFGL